MPQEFHVIRCFACCIFQVHQVKKKPKWQCKMCGENQSVRKVYGRGSGKECRFLVQSLNMTAGQIDDENTHCQPDSSGQLDEATENLVMNANVFDIDNNQQQSSRWKRFCEEEPEESSIKELEDCQELSIPSELVTTERPTRFKRKKSQSSFGRGPSGKRIRQNRKSDWETLPECDNQEMDLYTEYSSHDSMKVPSLDSHFSTGDVRHRSEDAHHSSLKPAHSFSLKKDSSVWEQYEPGFNPGHQTAKSDETADGALVRHQSAITSDSKNTKQGKFKQLSNCASSTHTSPFDFAKVKNESKLNSSACQEPSSSRWAIFAEPDSDDDDAEDFGEEAHSGVDISLERKNYEVTESYECIDGNAFGHSLAQHQVGELNESIGSMSRSGLPIHHLSVVGENHSLERKTFRQSAIEKNSIKHLNSHQSAEVEGKSCGSHTGARRPQSSILNSIQNSVIPPNESGKSNAPQVWHTKSDTALHIATRETKKCHGTDQKQTKSGNPFQVAHEDLEDLPDDFDVW